MAKTTEFLTIINGLCLRPGMYVLGETFYEICAYITGYAQGSNDSPLSNEGWEAFNNYVCTIYNYPEKYIWTAVLKNNSKDDNEAIQRLLVLLTDFTNKSQQMSYHEIILEAKFQAAARPEGEPEKVMRKFLSVIWWAKRHEIEPIILPHPHADILWRKAYPVEAADALESISNSYTIGRVSGSEDEGSISLMTADFPFPLNLHRINGQWKVDASPIINLWNECSTKRE